MVSGRWGIVSGWRWGGGCRERERRDRGYGNEAGREQGGHRGRKGRDSNEEKGGERERV